MATGRSGTTQHIALPVILVPCAATRWVAPPFAKALSHPAASACEMIVELTADWGASMQVGRVSSCDSHGSTTLEALNAIFQNSPASDKLDLLLQGKFLPLPITHAW